MKRNLKLFVMFSIGYLFLLVVGIIAFRVLFNLKFTDTSVISNIFVWSATLFAPISAFFIFEGWKIQHNKSVERSLAEQSSINLNKIKENLGQIYYAMYLNKITKPYFYPVNDKAVPSYLINNILDFNKVATGCATHVDKDLNRLSRKNKELKAVYDKYNNEFNNLHSNLFYFVDLKMQGKFPALTQEQADQKFFELYDHYHSFSDACTELDTLLDDIIFI